MLITSENLITPVKLSQAEACAALLSLHRLAANQRGDVDSAIALAKTAASLALKALPRFRDDELEELAVGSTVIVWLNEIAPVQQTRSASHNLATTRPYSWPVFPEDGAVYLDVTEIERRTKNWAGKIDPRPLDQALQGTRRAFSNMYTAIGDVANLTQKALDDLIDNIRPLGVSHADLINAHLQTPFLPDAVLARLQPPAPCSTLLQEAPTLPAPTLTLPHGGKRALPRPARFRRSRA